MMRRVATVLAALLVSVFIMTGCKEGAEEGSPGINGDGSAIGNVRVALVLPEPAGVNPFYLMMDEGLREAAEQFGIEADTIESADPSALEAELGAAAEAGYDLIITATFNAVEPLARVAEGHPDTPFAIIDTSVDVPNVRSIVFREYEASYLLGAAAGLATKTGVVGNVVAADIPLMRKFTYGFEQGLLAVNPYAQVLVDYTGGFIDPVRAKELALKQHAQGADFIAAISAVGDLGVFEAAKEKGFYVSGQDTDRTVLDPEHIVLSQLKFTDAAVYNTVKDFVEGRFTFGVRDYGLAEGGVGLSHVTHESETPLHPYIGKENLKKLKKFAQDLIEGRIVLEPPDQDQDRE